MKRKLILIVCVLALLWAGVPRSLAASSSPDPGAVAADAIIVRPFCFLATLVGGAVFVISLPVAVPTKSVHRAADSLVGKPWRSTVKRPLGDLDSISDY